MIGGGDTGSDCIGTSRRQGALSITQLEIMPRPPDREDKLRVWPDWPLKMRTSSSHEEGAEREFSVKTAEFVGENGVVKALALRQGGRQDSAEIPGSCFSIKADLVLLAMGFVGPLKEGMLEKLGLALDPRGNVAGGHAQLRGVSSKGLRLRRHAPRPVARGLGDPRRAAMRGGDRRIPDGRNRSAEVNIMSKIGNLVLRSDRRRSLALYCSCSSRSPAPIFMGSGRHKLAWILIGAWMMVQVSDVLRQ